MVVAVLSITSLLGFLSDLDLLDGIVLRKGKIIVFLWFLFCFVLFRFVGGGFVSFLEI